MSDALPDPRRSAAVVYDDGVAVDELLLVFASELGDGVRLGGVLQMARDTSCGPRALMRLYDLATRRDFPICYTTGTSPEDCALDPNKLRHAAGCIRAAVDDGAELVFVSRFGKEEVRGGGFRGELLHAAAAGSTVLTAVRRGNVDHWLALHDGLGTLLEARLWVLHYWWNDLQRTRRCAA